jgi:hypothetical protein
MLRDLRDSLKKAGSLLQTGTASDPAFLDAMRQAARIAGDFQQLLERFKALDANGAVRALAVETSKRATAFIGPDRKAGADTLSRDKYAMDELSRQVEQFENQIRELILRNAPVAPAGWWGAPAGSWDGDGRRDAENARRRIIAQFERARREAALGFDAVLVQRGRSGSMLPDAPLAGSLFAWRMLHSSLGGEAFTRRTESTNNVPNEQLVRWLKGELDETGKAMRRTGGVRRYQDQTLRWIDSASGYLRY